MRIIYRLLIGLGLVLALLSILGYVMPPPKPPAAGKLVTLPDGTQINTYEKGEGPDLVLVHGLPGSAQDWVEMADALSAQGYHVVYYDRIGYGLSARRNKGAEFTMAKNGAELDALIKAMDLKNPALVGWSFGGGTVLASQSARNPETPFIVLMAAVGPDMQVNNPKPAVGPVTEWLMRLPIIGAYGAKASIRKRFGMSLPQRWVGVQRAMLLIPGTLESMKQEMHQLNPASLEVSDIRVPVLILHGDADKMVPYEVGEKLVDRILGARLGTFEGAGHMLPLANTKPVALAIKRFTRKLDQKQATPEPDQTAAEKTVPHPQQ